MKRIVTTLLIASLSGVAPALAEVITCSSNDHEHNYCRVDTSRGVTLVHQLSRSGCWQGDTWGYDRGGVWVANGCRAEFQVGRPGSEWANSQYHNSGSRDRVDWDDRNDVDRWADEQSRRRAEEERKHDDKVGTAVGAALAIGILAAAAKHEEDRDRHSSGYQSRSVLLCESQGREHTYCSVPGSFHHVELKRQLSRSTCQYNRSWGYDRRGIWVGDGCRAEFWVD
jgi:hypothetical protein